MGCEAREGSTLGTSLATFSADGAAHLSPENHLMKTMQNVFWAQNPWLERQHWWSSPGPYSQRVLVSNTDTHTPLSETIDSTGAAKTDVEKLAPWLSWQLCLQGQGGNEDSTSLLNPCIWRTLRTFSPLPSLRFPPSVSQCCLFMVWFVSWIHLLKAHSVPGTVHGTDLSENKTKIPALEELSFWGMGKADNSILEGNRW